MKLNGYFPSLPDFDTSEAVCAQTDPELFYPDSMSHSVTVNAAKALCGQCPVVVECLSFALRTKETEGIWGGMTPKERFKLLNKRGAITLTKEGAIAKTNGRGRPRLNTNI
jgi:WhiB family redox-sensing transcriptional regulator